MYALHRRCLPCLIAALLTSLTLKPGPIHAEDFPTPVQLKPQAGLPDPLVLFDGRKVESKEQWEKERRPELKKLFQHFMYGKLPEKPAAVRAKVERSVSDFLGGKATLKEVTLTFEMPGGKILKHPIHLLLIAPSGRKGPAPVFIGMNFCGNHAVVDEPKIRIPDTWVYNSCKGVEKER